MGGCRDQTILGAIVVYMSSHFGLEDPVVRACGQFLRSPGVAHGAPMKPMHRPASATQGLQIESYVSPVDGEAVTVSSSFALLFPRAVFIITSTCNPITIPFPAGANGGI